MPAYSDQSSLVGVLSLLAAVVAIVGTQVLGWEWGSGQLVPTIIGVVVAAITVLVVVRRLA
ncbi:multidrug transporter [Saliphagus sp. GCM10025308]